MLIHLLDLLNAFLTAAAQPEDGHGQGATGSRETEYRGQDMQGSSTSSTWTNWIQLDID